MRVHLGFVFGLCILCNCTGESPRPGASVVRDSAGIQIVENTRGVWQAGSGWQLASAPSLDIGRADGDSNYQLFRVRGALRLEDGVVIVANGGSYELRWYDKEGRFLRRAGRKGGGPGEFQFLRWLARYGRDSIAVWDARNRRISIFDLDAVFGRSIPLRFEGTIRGVFGDGSFLVEQLMPSTNQGLVRHQAMALRYVPDGEILDSLGVFMDFEQISTMQKVGSGFRFTERSRPFGREAVFAVAGTSFIAGTQDRFELETHDLNGALTSFVRVDWANKQITNESIDEFKRELIANSFTIGDTARMLSELDELPYPETMPAYGSILVDEVGNLWVQKYRAPGDSSWAWVVFDADRQMLGVVEMPPGLEIYQIGQDFVLGKWRDESDVEHVGFYDLRKK